MKALGLHFASVSATLMFFFASPVLLAGEKQEKQEKQESQPDFLAKQKYVLKTTSQRDPFTIWKEDVVPPTGIKLDEFEKEIPPGVKDKDLVKVAPGLDVSKMVDDAYKLLYEGAFVDCVKKCDDALNKMEDPSGLSVHVTQLQERCLRIQKAAKKLKMRADVQGEFAQLPIRIEGIVWKPKGGFAVINTKVMGVGEIVQGARIYQINPQDVVFMYKGLKVSKKLFEGGKTDGGKASKGRK